MWRWLFISHIYSHIFYHPVNYPSVNRLLLIDFPRRSRRWNSAKRPRLTIKKKKAQQQRSICPPARPWRDGINNNMSCAHDPGGFKTTCSACKRDKCSEEKSIQITDHDAQTRRRGFALKWGILWMMHEGHGAFISQHLKGKCIQSAEVPLQTSI